jgi:hypothetical protein
LLSGEHYVSESILELIFNRFGQKSNIVLVKNLAFQKRELLERLGISNLTARMLCRTHNGLLSPFDSAGKAMFVAMDSLNETGLGTQLPAAPIHIDGDGLERWMLKTLAGGLYSGNFPLPCGASFKGIPPSRSWLDILFNGAEFPPGLGLYCVHRAAGEIIEADPLVLKLMPWISDDGCVVLGLRIWLFDSGFLLLANEAAAPPAVLAYRPTGFHDVATGARIQLDWQTGPQSAAVEVRSLGPPAHLW